jgi:hypothetical protein
MLINPRVDHLQKWQESGCKITTPKTLILTA